METTPGQGVPSDDAHRKRVLEATFRVFNDGHPIGATRMPYMSSDVSYVLQMMTRCY